MPPRLGQKVSGDLLNTLAPGHGLCVGSIFIWVDDGPKWAIHGLYTAMKRRHREYKGITCGSYEILISLRRTTLIVEHQMEKKVEHDMETGIVRLYRGDPISLPRSC